MGEGMIDTDRIRIEASRAELRYGPFHSTHEAYGVLAEEVAELFAAICANDLGAVEREAVQVSAVAARLAEQCGQAGDFAERSAK